MAIGDAGGLFVPDSYNNRVLQYDAPFELDALADRVWGQSSFSGNLCNRGLAAPTAETLCFHSSTNQNAVERYGSKLLSGDYTGVASALGAYAERVTDPGDVSAAITRATARIEAGQTAVLEFVTREFPVFSRG
jgi:hypothetical protein